MEVIIMMECPKCKRNLVGDKKVKDVENKWDVARGAAFILGGPVTMTAATIFEGMRLYDKYGRDEVEVKCPHCKTKITLTKEQYKELKKQIKDLQKNKRHAKQNRID
jgi:uncharacterized protein YbaR (Trm112 family)